MCGFCDTDLSQLSEEQLVKLASEVDETLCTILKVDPIRPRTLAVEESLSRATTDAWKKAADKAVDGSIGQLTRVDRPSAPPGLVRAFLKSLSTKLKKIFSKKQLATIEKKIGQIYKKAKRISAKQAKVAFKFALRDRNAIKAIRKRQVFWVGDFYSTHLSERIQAVAEEVMLNRGLSSRTGGRVLRDVLRREFGIEPGGRSNVLPNIPARFAGNPDLYFRGVSSTSAHVSRTFGSMFAFQEAEIISYELINPSDERTGEICQVMNGQVFSVEVGVKHMERILEAEDPKEVKEIAPWKSGAELQQIVGNSKTGSTDAARKLANAGAILPPFHPLCRTEPVIVS